MNPTITTEELLQLSKSADLLRQTAEKAMRFDEADRLVNEHAESWRQIREALPEPDPADPPVPLARRVVARLMLVDELQKQAEQCQSWRDEFVTAENRANRLGIENVSLTGELGEAKVDLARARQERKKWEDTAAHHARNEAFYRDLLDKVAAHLGPDVFVSDDGSVQDEPLRLKIPGLVERLARENETLARNVPPEPSAQGTAIDDIRTVEVIGQQWCRVIHESDVPDDSVWVRLHSGYIVLCNVLRKVETGA